VRESADQTISATTTSTASPTAVVQTAAIKLRSQSGDTDAGGAAARRFGATARGRATVWVTC
jgi:hypothetical protein